MTGDLRADAAHALPSPWFHVRLGLHGGTRVDVIAVVSEGGVSIEDVRAQPPLSVTEFASLAEWMEGPVRDACQSVAGPYAPAVPAPSATVCPEVTEPAGHRARSSLPRGVEGRRVVADAYRAAQSVGADPVLAVMCATGRSRRKSLRMIAGARDAGLLAPRHNRR
ncbi:DUF6214 family protein [Streptomyces sp. cg28]|uniref:DUF6214 family protein n=1 Tax=Streptomyces sp. cg28 TaxID=3403457 RepID=UPI003B20D597